MKENQQRDIQEVSPANLRINILNNINNNINNNNQDNNNINNINNNISDLSTLIKTNKERNNFQHNKGRQKNNIDINFANFSHNNNIELNTNNTNDAISPYSISSLQKISEKADKLLIEVINSVSLEKNLKIEINPLGMVQGSKRNANDGFTFFGLIDEEEEEETEEKNKDVDFIINTNDINNDMNNNIIGRHFRIRFDINTMKYYIKDLGLGFGTFKKIIKKEKIKDTYLINVGNSYIVCTFGVDEYFPEGKNNFVENGDKTLNIRVFSDIPQTEPYFFNPNQFKRIYIGRDISCNIIIDDSLLSRVHCTIDYDEEEGWIIHDGKIDENEAITKPSTNGTWLFLIEETQIDDGLIFKNNKNAFECHIIKHKNDNIN